MRKQENEKTQNGNTKHAILCFFVLTILMFTGSILLIGFYAPVESSMGVAQKIFYFHVSSAWIAFLSFFVTFVASLRYLSKHDDRLDALAVSSVEIGLVFCGGVLISGPIWAKSAWGVWWNWEPRLTTMLLLAGLYIGYMLLRSAFSNEEKKIYSAVMGLVNFVSVPVVYFSVRFWGSTLHPSTGVGLPFKMKITLFVTLAAFSLFYIYLLIFRYRLELLDRKLEMLKARCFERLK